MYDNMYFFNTTTEEIPTTEHTPADDIPHYVGYICACVAVLFFGSNFVPVKKFETGDGMFFQWVLCSAIWCVGLIVNCIRDFPTFYPLCMLGGFLWATGNIMVVPIIKTIGLGLGMLVWGSFNLLFGWASGRFGWFGIHPEVPNHLALNYTGVSLAALSAIIFLFVKTEVSSSASDAEKEPLLNTSVNRNEYNPEVIRITVPYSEDDTFIDRLSPFYKRVIGFSLSVVSGSMYGLSFAPVIYVQDNYPGASKEGPRYSCCNMGSSCF